MAHLALHWHVIEVWRADLHHRGVIERIVFALWHVVMRAEDDSNEHASVDVVIVRMEVHIAWAR